MQEKPDADIIALESIKDRIDTIAARHGYDKNQDFFKQEFNHILAKNAHNPAFSMYDFTVDHLHCRGYVDRGMPEHDVGHLIYAAAMRQGLKDGIFKPEDSMDFQTMRTTEVFAFDMEVKISPDGIISNFYDNNPDAIRLSPFHPDIDKIAASVESEENYLRSMLHIIGGKVGERAANIRYAHNTPEPDLIPVLERIVNGMGYKTSLDHDGSVRKFSTKTAEWSIETPEGARYFWNADGKHELPKGSNGVEEFQPIKFPDKETVDNIYKLADPALAYINRQRGEKTVAENLKSVRTSDILGVIKHAADGLKSELGKTWGDAVDGAAPNQNAAMTANSAPAAPLPRQP